MKSTKKGEMGISVHQNSIKKLKAKHNNLKKLEVDKYKAWKYANARKGYWRISNSPILARALSNKYLKEQGFITLTEKYL